MPLDLETAIEAFALATDAPPDEALLWALEHWDEAAPRFLSMLKAYTDGTDESDTTARAMFFIIHLFGDRGEKRAYRTLCRLMLDEDRLLSALGEVSAVDTLKGILIKCFDGDASPLRAVIESTDADSITRGEALLALAWLARDGRHPEPEFREYLDFLMREMRPREEDYIWYNLAVVAAILGYEDFDSDKLIADGLVPPGWMTDDDLAELLASGDPTGNKGLIAEEVVPFDNIVEALAGWPWEDDLEDEEEIAPKPYVNPLRHVGRNDPCPCGSGKKFKNCHLVVE